MNVANGTLLGSVETSERFQSNGIQRGVTGPGTQPHDGGPLGSAEPDEQLHLVVVGHVDHGKSTVIGRLMADTGSLPIGKLEQVRERCARSSRPFEYAFLLDALKNEQSQGITIDTARCFFKTQKRRYIINDAPGHIEFLKNMVTGASRAEAALLVIDAHEGIRENSKRHGFILSLLGLSQISVVVNKMDLVNYDRDVFERVRDEYAAFLAGVGVTALSFIPVVARDGGNIANRSDAMPWYAGPTVLEQVDGFTLAHTDVDQPFRMPLQDVYKFTASGDERRIFAGSISSGAVSVGTKVKFLPSRKVSTIATVEAFSSAKTDRAWAGQAVGFTLTEQIYVKPGELMVSESDSSVQVTSCVRATVFWMGRAPLVPNKKYTMKIGAARVPVELREINRVIDASELSSESQKTQLERHDVGEVLLETARPIACDNAREIPPTGRFVLVDHFEIAGCGVVLEGLSADESLLDRRVRARDYAWVSGAVTKQVRAHRYGHTGKFILIACGGEGGGTVSSYAERLAARLEQELFASNRLTYYLAMANLERGHEVATREEHIHSLGEQARVLTDAGLLFVSTLTEAEDAEIEILRVLNRPAELVVVRIGEPYGDKAVSMQIEPGTNLDEAVRSIVGHLISLDVIVDYCI